MHSDATAIQDENGKYIATFLSSTRLSADDVIFIRDTVYKVISVHFTLENPNDPSNYRFTQNITTIQI